MGFDDGFANRQSQAGAAGGAGAGFIHAEEAFEDARAILERDARSGIGHAQNDRTGCSRQADVDLAAGVVVLNGVVEKVGYVKTS